MIRADYKANGMSLKRLILGFFTCDAFYAVLLYRMGNFFARHKVKFLPNLCTGWMLRKFGCEISAYATIGKGFRLYHTPGIVIGWGVEIGENCEVFQNVTMGENRSENRRERDGRRFPKLGDNCSVFAGACILGPVTLGDHCKVGANCVVTHDFPDGSTIVGIPGRLMKPHEHTSATQDGNQAHEN